MSNFWNWTVSIIVILHMLAYLWLLYATSKKKVETKNDEDNTTGHVWDEDLTEYNNPLPRWWLWLFVITIIFSGAYLYLYPGLGNYQGSLDWSQTGQYQANQEKLMASRNKIYSSFIDKPNDELVKDSAALKVGRKLFAMNCSQCHGSDAEGAVGFPNLADNDWNYGGEFEQIKTSIAEGRKGVMPPFASILQEDGVKQVAAYVRSLSENNQRADLVKEGHEKYKMICSSCHGDDAKGKDVFGAPNLADNIWLHGSSDIIEMVLTEGLNANMPAHKHLLDDNSIKLVTAYVYSLSQ
jgi:cytochrome c oxidase cbb3-type subunit 3